MTSYERVVAALNHREADRVPMFLLFSFYGAKELQIPIKEYFSRPENVVTAQMKLRDKYKNDCIYSFFYAAIEIEAFGGETLFVEDGPPNSGEPLIKSIEEIKTLKVPRIEESQSLCKVLTATQILKEKVGESTPIIGVVMSPFSLPIMQMGFEKYLELLYFRQDLFEELMWINEQFCVMWANAQLKSGASAIGYFNPMASPTMLEREKYLSSGYKVDKRTIASIKGLTATHLGSGITLPVLDDLIATGTDVIGFSSQDDCEKIKRASHNKVGLLGNLNTLEMVQWNYKNVKDEVTNLIAKAGKGGGLILAENHGDIPWQVPEEVLFNISEVVQGLGKYPLEWV